MHHESDEYRLNGARGHPMDTGGGSSPRLSSEGWERLEQAAKAYNKPGPGRSKIEVRRKVRGPADKVKTPWD